MTTLTDFLLARIAEDEEVAREAGGSPFKPIPRWLAGESNGAGIRREDGVPVAGHSWPHEMDHIARHDPARVLAECEAKRRIVEASVAMDAAERAEEATRRTFEAGEGYALRGAVQMLATVYADHPDYQAEWASA